MTKNILLHSGQEIILVEVPEKSTKYELFGRHLRYDSKGGWGKWFRNINTQNIFKDKTEMERCSILGTYSATDGIFSGKAMLTTEIRNALKTHAQEGKWAVILKQK